MAKRKRTNQPETAVVTTAPAPDSAPHKKLKSSPPPGVTVASSISSSKSNTKVKAPTSSSKAPFTIQIITGSYDRILHGITANITPPSSSSKTTEISFADTFLFNAHTSAIRTLALSPPSSPAPKQLQKIILATGSTDERINLYHLSCHAPSRITVPAIPSLTSRAVVENPQNKELGSLLHHGATVTKVYFANRGKLLSSAEDSTIAVTRTRDWSLLSTIKAPIPKALGRPSGDTAPVGGAPSGINDFAVHPSMKLMISVGKSEKCMRLWNLVTGKKAGALGFEREMLNEVGEGKWSSGEGRRVVWDAEGEQFVVVFERGALVFGVDCKVRCKVVTRQKTKLHQLVYVDVGGERSLIAASTEDGRILFFSTSEEYLEDVKEKETLKSARLVAQLGGKEAGVVGRIKDFSLLRHEDSFIISTANSEGVVKVWSVGVEELNTMEESGREEARKVGKVLGTLETNNRITCLVSYVMLPAIEGDGVKEEEEKEEHEQRVEKDSESDNESESERSEL